ncbi:MAG: alpha/beta fold hydrolase, partial [Actinomycetota bacterium]
VLVDPGGFTARWPGSVLACRVIGSARVAPTMMRVLPRLYLRHRNATVDTIRSNATAMSRDPARVAAFASIWRSFAEPAHDARDAAARVTAPTMLVWGRRDPVLPWWTDGRRARRAFPNAAIVPLPCGHQAFAELPDAFLASVEPFLTDIPEEAP